MTKKINTVLTAPVLNRSGYGTLSDDVFHSLAANERLDIKVIQTNWGSCVPKFCIRKKDLVIDKARMREQLKVAPELFVAVNLPHIIKPVGKFKVIVSCIVEVDKAHDYLIDGLNEYNLGIVTSNFCKDVLNNCDKKPKIPIEVVYWGADTSIFKMNPEPQAKVDEELAAIKESEVFLFSGQITHPQLFKDRKDMDTMVKTFLEAFRDKPDVALLLKVNGTNFGYADRNGVLERIRALRQMANSNAPVYLLHGELSEKEMAYLYAHKKVIATLGFTHGESFGMTHLQSSLAGKPTFVSNYSAPAEYITNNLFLLDGELKEIPSECVSEHYPKGSKWFYVDTEKAKAKLLDFYNNREPYNKAAIELANINAEKFSLEKMAYRLNKILNKYL